MSGVDVIGIVFLVSIVAYRVGAWVSISADRDVAEGAGVGRYEVDPDTGRWFFRYGLPEEETER